PSDTVTRVTQAAAARSPPPDKENRMADITRTPANPGMDELEDGIPFMQQLLDNPFILLFLGVVIPTVLYIIWGVMEIVGIPVAK
ncbi:MAG: hypothetical protein ACREUP_07275, partial [Burkholderiales bacterium]